MAEMRMENAREPEQLQRMQEAELRGECYFCRTMQEETPIFINQSWFVKKNDFPYDKGVAHHLLLVSRRHTTDVSDLSRVEAGELIDAIDELKTQLALPGFSLFVRSGELIYTGATIDHLHFHLLSGTKASESAEKIKVTLAYKEPQ